MEGEGYRREEGEELELLPGPGEVVVLDSARCVREEGRRRGEGGEEEKMEFGEVEEGRSEDKVGDDKKEESDVGHLLAALSYWCQGKPLGCFLEPQVTRCRDIRVTWHPEKDYNSRYYTLAYNYSTTSDTTLFCTFTSATLCCTVTGATLCCTITGATLCFTITGASLW